MRDCSILTKRVFNYVKDNNIKKVILVGNWTEVTDAGYSDTNDMGYFISTPDHKSVSQLDSRMAFKIGITNTIEAYNNIGVRVFLLTQAPRQLVSAKTAYYRAYSTDTNKFAHNLYDISVPFYMHRSLQSFVDSIFEEFEKNKKIKLIRLDKIFCNKEKCMIGTTNESYYFDDDHLSNAGASKLNTVIRGIIVEQ